jgi:hypothetical protein
LLEVVGLGLVVDVVVDVLVVGVVADAVVVKVTVTVMDDAGAACGMTKLGAKFTAAGCGDVALSGSHMP